MSDLLNRVATGEQTQGGEQEIGSPGQSSDLPAPDSYGPFAQIFSVATIAICSYVTMLIC